MPFETETEIGYVSKSQITQNLSNPRVQLVKDTQLIFFENISTGGGEKALQITPLGPRGGFFGPRFFIILKNSHQDLSNEGSNFILSSLEVGH